MILVIGGAYQGKLTWVKEHFPETDKLCNLAEGSPDGKTDCAFHLEALSKTAARDNIPLEELMDSLDNIEIIISRDVGSGIVPMDAQERQWREYHGRLLQMLSVKSERVYRIFCGLEERLK